ncbi:hypothetical protein [Mucilaginibacter myungsuensis]|uniref:Uncharacterized protein n=1 Tax=Mucilaginibacter myungsuensis TaxID=649104 RepID=A0A929KYJ9_9SPHI|nr:hypothetical protein [Mucilaginibacter myungsuensis]MBE9662905.1 hypothetical protein [Mucilaginibacter myungsuensis]MDN3598525.1 hypothetical protein [Mucilaginibacter myungsuensis]
MPAPYKNSLLIPALLLFFGINASAQKLPNKQKENLWTSNVKVDGKLTEAEAGFRAYNTAVEAFYTLANDDANLYLTVKSGHGAIVKRILNGGLTLTVKPTGEKKGTGVAVGYPFYEGINRMTFYNWVLKDNRMVSPEGAELDSLMKLNNDRMSQRAKVIRVAGIVGVDSLISVYNEHGIKAVGGFDGQLNYVYEVSIPLRYLTPLLKADTKFAYQIKINATKDANIVFTYHPDGSVASMTKKAGAVGAQEATDLWGEYALAKKL